MQQESQGGGYGIRAVAELLDASPARVRSWAKAGLVTPGRGPRGSLLFSFRDVAFLRRVRDLEADRVPPRRVRRVLERLRACSDLRLTDLVLEARRGEVVMRDGEALWSAESGQGVFDFAPRTRGAAVVELGTRAARHEAAREREAEDWYALGCELERSQPERARQAYQRAVEIDPGHAEAHIDLGCLCHEQGDFRDAEVHYRAAVALRPGDATAQFNLAVVLDDQRREPEARAGYESALAADPACSEAHFNLARLCERAGDRAGALRHLTAYRRLSR
jgi:tetratricopeptide (TPR) repeat protein